VVAFTAHLAGSAVERGLIGPREVPRLWERHVLNCAVVQELVPQGARAADVGSGAGLPGIVVAIARPDVRVTLIEPLQRRVSWLEEVVDDLALENVDVRRARAEDLHGRFHAEVVLARAVAALPTLATWCLPLLSSGGSLLALKGRTAEEELLASVPELRRRGAGAWGIERCGEGLLETPTTVVVVTRAAGGAVPPRGTERAPGGRGGRGGAPSGGPPDGRRGGGRRPSRHAG
jgi:16S rRNA (guanine527-N7)-methyltransferase